MKKILAMLSALSLTATPITAVVACGDNDPTTSRTSYDVVDDIKDMIVEKISLDTEKIYEIQTEVYNPLKDLLEDKDILAIDGLQDVNTSINGLTPENEYSIVIKSFTTSSGGDDFATNANYNLWSIAIQYWYAQKDENGNLSFNSRYFSNYDLAFKAAKQQLTVTYNGQIIEQNGAIEFDGNSFDIKLTKGKNRENMDSNVKVEGIENYFTVTQKPEGGNYPTGNTLTFTPKEISELTEDTKVVINAPSFIPFTFTIKTNSIK
ncbi:lipoprotein [Spiroplasma culicicola]|uniref:Lipoprotein n=1 Tax=Spiroplasma culicicola AES-1 TaxID=1276246 RepID=W6A7D7_9MOLU|nr:lipoprotein [Spiroplasma culicicola]AHI52896.1 hypothetical protein SCULI_v1c05550 [Spiroplasma culicicola AES-1]